MSVVNDVHSRLNETTVDAVVPVDSLESIGTTLDRARSTGRQVSIAGGPPRDGRPAVLLGRRRPRHAPARRRPLDRRGARPHRGRAGIQWPALIDALAHTLGDPPEADRRRRPLHRRRGLGERPRPRPHLRPFVDDVESLVVVGADGVARTCSRDENADLFRLVCGGYGLFGVVHSATLRLDRRRKVERVVRLAHASELEELFAERIEDGYLYGDFQFAIDPASPDFLQRGICSCYRPVARRHAARRRPQALGRGLEPTPPPRAPRQVARLRRLREHYLATSGQVYLSDRHQLATYVPGYHWDGSSEMISELYVPRPLLADFLAAAARDLRALEADVVYGTVRLIERDDETFLAWAREPWACVVLNLHVEHTRWESRTRRRLPAADRPRARARRELLPHLSPLGDALGQLLAAYPQLPAFLEAKRAHDPDELFQSDWYRWLCATIELEAAA